MKIAVTIWEERVSPVFDSSRLLIIAENKNEKIVNRREEPFNSEVPFILVNRLNELSVDVLICGAISQMPATIIENGNVLLIPFIGGIVNEVLDCCIRGKSPASEFLLPGCGRMKCCRQKEQNYFFKNEMKIEIVGVDGKVTKRKSPRKREGSIFCNMNKKGLKKGSRRSKN